MMDNFNKRVIIWLDRYPVARTSKYKIYCALKGGLAEFVRKPYQYFDLISSACNYKIAEKVKQFIDENPFTKFEYDYLINKDGFTCTALTIEDKEYPKMLKETDAPPIVLFAKGDISLLNTRCMAIVGSRKISPYGERITKEFASGLGAGGFTIVSGMAYGVDAVAHKTALQEGAKTIAVLGTGLDVVYPKENQKIYDSLIKNGLIISEYPLGTTPLQHQFPERNYIISGLSEGVVVTEAGEKSGALITANFAIEQNRDIYSVPGDIYAINHKGCNDLLKRYPTCCVTSPYDILAQKKINYVQATFLPNVEEGGIEAKVVSALQGGQLHFDQLAEILQIPTNELNSLLTRMELLGMINKYAGNVFGL